MLELDRLSMLYVVDWDVILKNLMRWRDDQADILRNPKKLTWEDQYRYKNMILDDDMRRYANKLRMWPICAPEKKNGEMWDYPVMVAWGGFTNIVWYNSQAYTGELSFIADTDIVNHPADYEAVFRFFLREIKKIWFRHKYWSGYRLYSETYSWPYRKRHIEILEAEGFVREGTLRNHVVRGNSVADVIIHGLNRGDLPRDHWEGE